MMNISTWKLRRGVAVAALSALTLATISGCASDVKDDASFPTSGITVLVPGAAGAAADSIARALAPSMETDLDQSLVVQNFGTETQGLVELKGSKADGYTIGFVTLGSLTLLPMLDEVGYAAGDEDFDVVAQVDTAPVVLLVRADSPIEDLDDYVAAAQGGGVSVGGPSGRAIPQANVAQLAEAADAPDYTYVEFGAGEQMVAILNGTVDAGVALTALASQYVESGQMRAIALFASVPVEGFDAPLATDFGYDVVSAPTHLVIAPKGTPSDVIKRLSEAVAAATESDAFLEFASASYIRSDYLGPDEAAHELSTQLEAFRGTADALGWLG